MARAVLLVSALMLISGCSEKPSAQNDQIGSGQQSQAKVAAVPATVKSQDGSLFTIQRVADIKPQDLPSNADLKMAGNDLPTFGMSLCDENMSPDGKLFSCDIYVQYDKSSSLIGYTVVGQGNKGVAFYTTANLNSEKGGGAPTCAFGGKLGDDVKDASHDFDSNLSYSAWEKEPGNWLISTDDAGDDQNFANGMWYIHRKGNNLRITQERWNPCYSSEKNGYIDDVFSRAVTLTALPRKS